MNETRRSWDRFVLGVVSGWLNLYTIGLDPEQRERRRAEIESDVWEQLNADRQVPAATVLTRFVRGIPDDVRWRADLTRADRWLPAVVFALCMTAGMQVGLLGPGFISSDRAGQLSSFYWDRLPPTILGHALIAIGLVLFCQLLARWHGIVRSTCSPLLANALLVSGATTALLAGATFALTLTGAVLGALGEEPTRVSELYRTAGFIFHVLMTGAMGLFLVTSGAVLAHGSSPRTSYLGPTLVLALLLGLEAVGGPSLFLVGQALSLGWAIAMNAGLTRNGHRVV